MKSTFVLGFCLLAAFACNAQAFAFAPGNANGESSTMGKVSGYKIKTAQKVFDDLLRARGDFRMQTPTLVLSKREGHIACFVPDRIQVVLDEKAYNLCTTFGKDSLNALASLLAHELIHYYDKHDWSRHFARENESLETARRLENMEEGLKQETQADYLGGFMAFSVGYNTYGIMPELLKKAYKAYDLPDNLPGYPELGDRVKMVDGAMEKLRDLQIVFETANLLTILGRYADASVYHQYILETYQSREIYNNSGVNAALAALALMGPTEMPYAMPLELDPGSRLFSIKNNDVEKEAQKNALLKLAQAHLERAILLDENYAPAYLNKACVLALKGEWEDADYLVRKGKKKTDNPLETAGFEVLQGISAALQNDSTGAVKYWEQAQKQGNLLAKANLAVLQHLPAPATSSLAGAKGVETIEQFSLADFLAAPTIDRDVQVAEKVFCGFRQLTQSKVFLHYANEGKNYALVQETQPSYTGRSLRGIGLGDGQEKVSAAYGRPAHSVALPAGTVWVYPETGIYFRFTPQGKVERWGVYRKSDF